MAGSPEDTGESENGRSVRPAPAAPLRPVLPGLSRRAIVARQVLRFLFILLSGVLVLGVVLYIMRLAVSL